MPPTHDVDFVIREADADAAARAFRARRMCFKAVDRVEGRATRWDDSAGFLMATEKTTGRQAVDYGNQVAGLHKVCDDLVGAVAEGLDEHCGADFISRRAQLRFWPRQASIAEGPAPQGAHDDRADASPSGSPGSE